MAFYVWGSYSGEVKDEGKQMKKLYVSMGCVALLCLTSCGETKTLSQETSEQVTNLPSATTAELKVEPGAVLMVWGGKDTSEAEITAMVDKGQKFNSDNGDADPAVKRTSSITCRWSGILNVNDAGIYTFNLTQYLRSGSKASISINGMQVFAVESQHASRSKNVKLPGPANIEITIYAENHTHYRGDSSLLLRYKKSGKISYTTITPETLFHGVE